MKEDEKNKHNAVLSQTELRRMRRLSLIKIGTMLVFLAIILVIGALGWFTMSREVAGTGMKMAASSENFIISSPNGENSTAGLWYDPYHQKIRGDSSESAGDIPAGVWLITDEANFGNYRYSDETERIGGIKPGSYGKVTFNVTPLVDEINLEFDFDIIGYHSSDSLFDEGN